MSFRYFRPKSLTWWGGFSLVLLGVTLLVCDTCNQTGALDQLAIVVATLNGGAETSPAALILLGLSIIGLRDKQERI